MNALQGVTVLLLLVATALVFCLLLFDFEVLVPPHPHHDDLASRDHVLPHGAAGSPKAARRGPTRPARRAAQPERRADDGPPSVRQELSTGAREVVRGVTNLMWRRYESLELDEYLGLHPDVRRAKEMPTLAVAFQVTTSPSTRGRIEAQVQGWLDVLPPARLWVFSSEAIEVDGVKVQTIPQSMVDEMGHKELQNDTGGYWPGKIRKIAAYKVVEKELPASVEWLVIADDDTFVNVENMRAILGKINPELPVLIGSVVENAGTNDQWIKKLKKQGFVKRSVRKLVYMQGGSGTAMSRAALRLIAPALLNESHDKGCPFLGAEDATVGMCARELGVVFVNNPYDFPNWAKARLSANQTRTRICQVIPQDELTSLRCPEGQILREILTASWGPTPNRCAGDRLAEPARDEGEARRTCSAASRCRRSLLARRSRTRSPRPPRSPGATRSSGRARRSSWQCGSSSTATRPTRSAPRRSPGPRRAPRTSRTWPPPISSRTTSSARPRSSACCVGRRCRSWSGAK